MVAVSVLVGSTNGRTPLLVAGIWTQIRNHDNDAGASSLARSTGTAGGRAGRCQVVALAAAATTPRASQYTKRTRRSHSAYQEAPSVS